MAAYIVHLPRRDVRRLGMFSTIVLRSAAIARVVSIAHQHEVRLVEADARIARVLAQMFPGWRIELLAEAAIEPRSAGPVLLHPAILAFKEDTIVAAGPAGHVDRRPDRPIER